LVYRKSEAESGHDFCVGLRCQAGRLWVVSGHSTIGGALFCFLDDKLVRRLAYRGAIYLNSLYVRNRRAAIGSHIVSRISGSTRRADASIAAMVRTCIAPMTIAHRLILQSKHSLSFPTNVRNWGVG
jgi:hypothetical protein